MKIKGESAASPSLFAERLRGRRATILGWAIVLVSLGLAFFAGAHLATTGRLADPLAQALDKLGVFRSQNVSLLTKAASGFLAEPEHLTIDIKLNYFQKLVEQRDRALASKVLTVTDEDYVPARVQHAGSSTPVKIRLKGDLADHFSDNEKWSFRIKARGENTIFGMKQFSLQNPSTRNHVYEWLYQQALRREGVLGLRYDFVRVTLNGRNLGVYALEEHFEKRLVENNDRREGPIVRFSEDRLWEEWPHQKIPFPGARQNGSGSYMASEVDAFQTSRWLASPELRSLHDKAIGMLRSFQREELATRDVFDIEKMATFLAVTDLIGAEHGARWHNTRFYYNPITSRLEPIGFDGDAGMPISFLCIHMKDRHWSYNAWSSDPGYFATLFSDAQFLEAYLAELRRVSKRSFVSTMLDDLRDELTAKLRVIYSEDPAFEFSPEVFYRNQGYIRSVIEPVAPIAAYARQVATTTLELRLGNLQALPVDVLGVTLGGDPEEAVPVSPPHRLSGRAPTDLVDFEQFQVALSADSSWSKEKASGFGILWKIPGVDKVHEAALQPWPFAEMTDPAADVLRRPSNVADFEFIETDESAKVMRIRPGKWTISQDLILPADHVLRAGPATRLILTDGAMLVTRSPLELIGSEDAPIIIESPDGTGQGVAVLGAGGTSTLEHVVFRSLGSPSRDGLAITGAITFYESPVRLSHCRFIDNPSEDALNLIRSTFAVDKSVFHGAPSDALDADFSRGEIIASTFDGCGNDGVDISGSHVEILGSRFSQTADKAISIGEQSQVRVNRVSIDRAKIAIAVKDSSVLRAREVAVSNSEIGLALYRKKPEFGPASADLVNSKFVDVITGCLVEEGSSATIDGNSISASAPDLARQLEDDEE